jgi:hypothetical protein
VGGTHRRRPTNIGARRNPRHLWRGGCQNIADDEPAQVSEWLPALAAAIGARPPYRIPVWMGRLAIGESGVVIMNELRGVSNAKARIGMEAGLVKLETGFQKGLAA